MAIDPKLAMSKRRPTPAAGAQPTPVSKPPKTDEALLAMRQSRMRGQPMAKPARSPQAYLAMRQNQRTLAPYGPPAQAAPQAAQVFGPGMHPQVSGPAYPQPPMQAIGAGNPGGQSMYPMENLFQQIMGQWLLRKQQQGGLPPLPPESLPAFPNGGAIPYGDGQMNLWV